MLLVEGLPWDSVNKGFQPGVVIDATECGGEGDTVGRRRDVAEEGHKPNVAEGGHRRDLEEMDNRRNVAGRGHRLDVLKEATDGMWQRGPPTGCGRKKLQTECGGMGPQC